MSEFHVEVVRVQAIETHPNADALGIVHVGDYPVCVRLGEFKPGALAVYVPVDAVVPATPQFAFLGDSRRIKAKRLRGAFSMGLLVAADPGMAEGEDVAERLGVTRYEPPEPESADDERDPGFLPVYTDIEGLRRWPDMLVEGEDVVIAEKIHGANARFAWRDGRLWVGSHTKFKRPDGQTIWNRIAKQEGLFEKLRHFEGLAVYGEVFGQVQDLKYGVERGGLRFLAFDAMYLDRRAYLNADEFCSGMTEIGIETVPVLHWGPWHPDLRSLAEGKSTLCPEHVREGFVVRPVCERFDERIGRVILKIHGEGYLTRKQR